MLSVCRVGAKSSKSNRGLAGCSGLKKRRNYSQKPRNFFDVDSYEITEADKKKWKGSIFVYSIELIILARSLTHSNL